MADVLTIHGLTFDRGRTRVEPLGRWVNFFDPAGHPAASIQRTVDPPRRVTPWVALLIHDSGCVYLDGRGRGVEGRHLGEDWAPLLRLADEAGLQLTAPA